MNRKLLHVLSLLAACTLSAQAATQEDLERKGEQFDALETEVEKVQEKLLSELTAKPSEKNLVYEYLNSCSNVLTSTNHHVTGMIRVLRMSQFVWDPTARKLAQPHIDVQARTLARQLENSATYLEKILHRSRDEQVAKLCLRARDLIKSTVPIAVELKPSWAPVQ
jgi:hypothetical protein